MHWLWRAILGWLTCFLCTLGLGYYIGDPIRMAAHDLITAICGLPQNVYGFQNMILPVLISWAAVLMPSFAAGLYVWSRLRPGTCDHETRCRKCQYILRGITEPRCPECGERI
jgi:hypothetical protein